MHKFPLHKMSTGSSSLTTATASDTDKANCSGHHSALTIDPYLPLGSPGRTPFPMFKTAFSFLTPRTKPIPPAPASSPVLAKKSPDHVDGPRFQQLIQASLAKSSCPEKEDLQKEEQCCRSKSAYPKGKSSGGGDLVFLRILRRIYTKKWKYALWTFHF